MAGIESLVRRWCEVAREVAPELPGRWQLRGRGDRTFLVQEPWDWTLRWIGFEREGWFIAGVEPLVRDDFGWVLSFGLRMRDVRDGPRRVDIRSAGAGHVLRDFALGPAHAELERWTIETFAKGGERSLLRPVERRKPPHYWMMAPAWRVILDTESPEAPLLEVIEYCQQREAFNDAVPFYSTFLERWRSGGRQEALDFLEPTRNAKSPQSA